MNAGELMECLEPFGPDVQLYIYAPRSGRIVELNKDIFITAFDSIIIDPELIEK